MFSERRSQLEGLTEGVCYASAPGDTSTQTLQLSGLRVDTFLLEPLFGLTFSHTGQDALVIDKKSKAPRALGSSEDFRASPTHLTAAIADGVSQSLFGQVAAAICSNAAVEQLSRNGSLSDTMTAAKQHLDAYRMPTGESLQEALIQMSESSNYLDRLFAQEAMRHGRSTANTTLGVFNYALSTSQVHWALTGDSSVGFALPGQANEIFTGSHQIGYKASGSTGEWDFRGNKTLTPGSRLALATDGLKDFERLLNLLRTANDARAALEACLQHIQDQDGIDDDITVMGVVA